MQDVDVIVLGAGAAGLMCALRAGGRGRRVLLLDHADAAGKKILISGGGRCNFTNLGCAPDRFLSANPHFARSALARYTQHDFVALVRRHRIPFHEKTLGQLFCDGSAREIVAMLLAECDAAGVDLRLSHRVTDIARADRFTVATDRGAFAAPALVLATGGLSIPKMGATGFAHDVARRFGLPLTEIRPGLVPLTFAADSLALMQPLAGVSLDSIARCGRAAFREAMLFTHRGLSGPAILQASSYWREEQPLTLDLLPERDAASVLLQAKRARPKAQPQTVLSDLLPQRLAQSLAALHLPPRVIGEVGDADLRRLAALLKAWRLMPSGTEGYAKAEVTLGGVDTGALDQRSMMAKSVPGLFVIGEAVDVTGWLGGYNFQWAWSSGWAAGEAA
ncbi:BaiN/RdsA family NAD(P)/FAD-dependent oxidoreductase [Falsiroseomonas oryzae]|uniref:NAD(P)/FAD-dependent oxidoreductase n=1 Tax=Falsiroseomonas oryzae TaxID=2766473 RepID=UPI0022EA7C76|nr:NAD(P)/FAD-dependent oxidoreductase [Roseomonas sp. MO-31]